MKSFFQQFSECKKAKLVGKGELQKFKDFPELLPHPFSRAAKPIAKALKKNPELGLQTLICKRFGGQCYSGNPRCRALRALPKLYCNSQVIANGNKLQQYDEHTEDESLSGNTDRADNLLTLAEFRSALDCLQVAEALNTLRAIATSKETQITSCNTPASEQPMEKTNSKSR